MNYLPFHNAKLGASENDAIHEGTSELLHSILNSRQTTYISPNFLNQNRH